MTPVRRKAARKKAVRKASRKKSTRTAASGSGRGSSSGRGKKWCTQDLDFRSTDDALWIKDVDLRREVDARYRAGTLRIGYNDPNSPSYEVNVKC
jgi:hypothetical protein